MATRPHWPPTGRARPRAPSLRWCLRAPCPRAAPAPARPSRPHSCPSNPPRPAPAPHPPRRPHRLPQPPPRGAASSRGCSGRRQLPRRPLHPQVSPGSSSSGWAWRAMWRGARPPWPHELGDREGVPVLPPGQAAPWPVTYIQPGTGPAGAGVGQAGTGLCCPQSQPRPQRPRQKSRTWKILFPKMALTAASWMTRPPGRRRRKSKPGSHRTVTGESRGQAGRGPQPPLCLPHPWVSKEDRPHWSSKTSREGLREASTLQEEARSDQPSGC